MAGHRGWSARSGVPERSLYVAATTEEQHAALAAAAKGFLAQNSIPNARGILTPVGILILSFVMPSGVFHKGITYLDIAT